MISVLSDLVVVEIASVLAGPAVGMYFAEKGARVIKVENKTTGGDVTRSWKLPVEDKDATVSAYFSSVNWHKEYVFLDFKKDDDLQKLKDIIEEADVLITNFKFGDAVKFGLDASSISKLSEKIIIAELSGFGALDERVAYDLVLQAETGYMSMNGEPNSKPVKMPVAFIDLFAAHQMKEGILEALLNQKENPGIYHVEISLYDAAIASLANQASNYLMANNIPQPLGSKHPNIAPYGEIFETKDKKQMTFAIGSNKQFTQLFEELGLESTEDFVSNKDRVANRDKIESIVADKVKLRDSEELMSALISRKVPVAIIKNLKDVFSDSKAKSMIIEEVIDQTPTKRVKTAVYNLKKL
jgi:crotonobetainyl-CoA:carnitine CoA-transferase CaiB-like acyl-CoA transferase